jgi:glycosyltransferase involved in cell wall biosynthesis
MDGSKKVAIITRTKDRPLLLQRAVASVASQTYKNYVHIIVNDGGTLEHQTLTSGTIIVPINSNGHMESASNAGLDAAKKVDAHFVVIHDDDDSWSPEFLSTMVREFETYKKLVPTVKGIICRANMVFERIDGNVIITDHLQPHAPFLPEIGLLRFSDLLDDHRNFAPIQFMYELEATYTIGQYDPTFRVYGDWDFNLRFLQHFDIALIPNYLAFYHQRITAVGSDANSIYEVDRTLQREVYRQMVQNKYLRTSGIGTLMNLPIDQIFQQLHQLQHQVHELKTIIEEDRKRAKRTSKSH